MKPWFGLTFSTIKNHKLKANYFKKTHYSCNLQSQLSLIEKKSKHIYDIPWHDINFAYHIILKNKRVSYGQNALVWK